METIILGTEGNQPFKITQSGVSRQHARITIDDNERWTLEDLNSTNGTFVRNEDGKLRRVSKVSIDPMTFICLGPDNSNGCSFYALHIKGEKNYIKEFAYMNELEDKFDAKEQKIEKTIRWEKWIILIINVLVCAISFDTKDFSSETRMWALRIVPLVTASFGALYDINKKKKDLMNLRKRFYRCPNPKCSHTLKPSEIRDMQCAKCKCK